MLHLAIYQSGLSTSVAAGENRGKTLQHDYIARAWAGATALSSAGTGQAEVKAQIPAATAVNAGVAAFVQNRRSGEVLQAYSLPLCAS